MPRATFVLCIEPNAIRAQALLLCESIRAWTGTRRHDPVVAIAPRPGQGVDAATRERLAALDVTYIEEPLNIACPEYGSANRVYAAAWAEAHARTEWIVVLDSDTVFLDEPALPEDADVAVRPVDSKGSATSGPDDPFEPYWAALARLGGIELDRLPFVRTTDGDHRVRASYNGGLIVARRSAGLLSAWAELFTRSVAAGLRPARGLGWNVHASTGHVGPVASEYWGSNQAAAAIAFWGRAARVREYPWTCNVPLHMLIDRPDRLEQRPAEPLVHVHYHWTLTAPHVATARRVLRRLEPRADRLDWLDARLPLPAA